MDKAQSQGGTVMKDISRRTQVKLGFLGLGGRGRSRMEALAATGLAEISGCADPDQAAVEKCEAIAGPVPRGWSLEDLLAARPDGVVIATASDLQARQAIQALEAGAAVFCGKPLGRNAEEAAAVVAAARRADRLLAGDLSYRHTSAVRAVVDEIASGALGTIRGVDLTFHESHGPDGPWRRDRARSGRGCLVDNGARMLELALWLLDWPRVICREARLRHAGAPLVPGAREVEDTAEVRLETEDGVPIRLACSWTLLAGSDRVIRCDLTGTRGSVIIRNIGGSSLDFGAWRTDGETSRLLAEPPDDWSARAAVDWLSRLSRGAGFDPLCARLVNLAETLDAIYARGAQEAQTDGVG